MAYWPPPPPAWAGKNEGIPRRRTTEPIRGEKRCVLRFMEGGLTYGSLGFSKLGYGADATAYCAYGRNHPAPNVDCTCGFYALKPPIGVSPVPLWPTTRLEVELLGRVIAHRIGYRGERQRVLAVHLPPGCVHPGCRVRPVDAVAVTFGNLMRRMNGHGPHPAQEGEGIRIDPVCSGHAPAHAEAFGGEPTPLADLAGALGADLVLG